jgi:hypothetical protein
MLTMKPYVGGELLVDTYKLQKNDMKVVSREMNQRIADLDKQLMAMK